MSERLKIMAEAEAASLDLSYNQSEGERRFKELLEQYLDDGMVYFNRGRGYEAMGRPEKALEDYRRAESLFPMRQWKKLAGRGVERCETDVELNKLPGELRGIWRDVVHKQVYPVRSRVMTARAALENTADFLIPKWGLTRQGRELWAKLATLSKSGRIEKSIIEDMQTVKDLGDLAAHGDEISAQQAKACFDACLRIVNFVIGYKLY